MRVELTIDRLGAQGDGIAESPGGPLFVPFTLPGERVMAEVARDGKHADCLAVLDASPERVAPVCPHFGACGGCSLQHIETQAYLAWKRELVVQALASRGLDVQVEPVRPVPLGSRRRATFSLERRGKDAVLGYRRARSHDTIETEVCPILSPAIVAALPALKAMLFPLLGSRSEARVGITETENGLDVVVEGARPTETALAKLAGTAGAQGIARITVGDESVMLTPPTLRLGRAEVRLPPGSLPPSLPRRRGRGGRPCLRGRGEGETHRRSFFRPWDVFLRARRKRTVDAYETDAEALAALEEAARHTPKLKPMRGHRRDLFRDPLGLAGVEPYDAVVFDPPRAGAAAQAEQFAKSKVKRLVAVSCNPGTWPVTFVFSSTGVTGSRA